ncbi:MAG: methyltransferase domain-containing protein [Ilumatobacter sp.]|nr:methyltransferase domain-containing protein [Ilumatobacter sp.]
MGDARTVRSFHVVVPEAEAELAADRLWQLGVEAVAVGEPAAGVVELWTSVGESEASLERATEALDAGWTWFVRDAVEPVRTWRDHARPSWYCERGVIVPAWLTVDVGPDVLVTSIDPESSFGLGDHPTTASAAALLAAHVRATGVTSVLDVGCGSGVLGIVAAQLGATVRAIDISAAAIEATEANAGRNGVSDRITADTASIAEIGGRFDLVAANILAPVLISMAADLVRVLAPAGRLLISGILDDAHEHVLEALAPLEVETVRSDRGWASVMLAPRADRHA